MSIARIITKKDNRLLFFGEDITQGDIGRIVGGNT